MNTITSIRLVNRSFIKEYSKDNRLLYLNTFIAACDKHSIGARVGTIGVEQNGSFVEAIYKRPETILTVDNFCAFLTEVSNCFDMYRGVQPYTIFEFDVCFIANWQGADFDGRAQFVVFLNHETNKIEQRAFDKAQHPILSIRPKLQPRITLEDIASAQRQSIFLQTNRGENGNNTPATASNRPLEEDITREERTNSSSAGMSCDSSCIA